MSIAPATDGGAVVFDRVTKAYGPTTALGQVSFELARGETVALLGLNGAGRSTAVDLMLGLRQSDAGTVSVLGRPARRAVAEGRVGAVLQEGGLPTGAKVGEVVDLARRLYGNRRGLSEVLEAGGLTGLAGRRVDRLSGGQAQRVRLAVALSGRPEVLFLDEPTIGFDPEARRRFWDRVRTVAAEGVTVVFTTHYLDEVDANAARVIVLADGRVVADGTPVPSRAAFPNGSWR